MTYEIRPVKVVPDESGGMGWEETTPAEAQAWGVYRRANHPDAHGDKLAVWVADFPTRTLAVAHVKTLPPDDPVSPEWLRYTEEVAFHAMYLMIGAERRRDNGHIDLDGVGGHVGLAEVLAAFAPKVVDFLQRADIAPLEFDDVFAYQVTEEMGVWLIDHLFASSEEFLAELERQFALFMGPGYPPSEGG